MKIYKMRNNAYDSFVVADDSGNVAAFTTAAFVYDIDIRAVDDWSSWETAEDLTIEDLAADGNEIIDEFMIELDKIENPIWYAVQEDPDDNDWGTGSRDYSEAREMAERYKEKTGFARIITIEDGADPVAIEEEII